MRRLLPLLLLLVSVRTAVGSETLFDDPEPRHRLFLEEVELLMVPAERDAFLALSRDYQRDAFIRRFWELRDPWPESARNELRESWQERVQKARLEYENLEEDRARMLLLNGPPYHQERLICPTTLNPLEVWSYSGSDLLAQSYRLVFFQPLGRREGRYRLWYPSQGLSPLFRVAGASVSSLQTIYDNCAHSEKIVGALQGALDWGQVEDRGLGPPHPGSEWVTAFADRSTDLPSGSEPLPAQLEIRFPGRHQSRTVVEAVVTVPSEAVGAKALLVDGEVLRQGELFEAFRYRFEPPSEKVGAGGQPLVLQRHLRPGPYRLILKVEEIDSPRVFREELALEVPRVAQVESAVSTSATLDPLAEAHVSLARGEHVIRLLEPPRQLITGTVRLEAMVEGPELARVGFWLDGRPVLRKTRPPYSVEVNLGDAPQLHVVRAVALDDEGHELAADEIVLNAGPHRFGLRVVEPVPGHPYRQSLRVRAEVEVPEREVFDRLEIFLGDELVGTLFQPPFDHPVLLPPGDPATFLRLRASLVGGASTETSVLINVPGHRDELHVQLVELFTTVLDRKGQPVEGLSAEDFRAFENGEERTIQRFDTVQNRPIHAGLLIDTSTSMVEEIEDAERAAAQFLRTVLRPGDRASVMVFNDQPSLLVPFTDDLEILAGGLADLRVEGETALWDAVVNAIYYFSGIKGKRAVVLLSDGEDVHSKYTFEKALDFAKRAGVSFYAIGLRLPQREIGPRASLRRLARETGGRFFFIEKALELDRVYRTIEEELRSQYLITYQSSAAGDDHDFRQVRVEVRGKGLEAKTISGYYP